VLLISEVLTAYNSSPPWYLHGGSWTYGLHDNVDLGCVPCGFVGRCQRFGETCCLRLLTPDMFFRNVGIDLRNHTAPKLKTTTTKTTSSVVLKCQRCDTTSVKCGHQRAYCSSHRGYMMIYEYGEPRWNDIDKRYQIIRRKLVPLPGCPKQIPHDLTRARTWATVVRGSVQTWS
jgi:hypothetical protein